MIKAKDLISIAELDKEEVDSIISLASDLKKGKAAKRNLNGKLLGLIFQKPSNRTRVSFWAGMNQLGGHCIYLAPEELQLGKREAVKDVARVLSGYLDVIAARTYKHSDLIELAENADIPVINALTDLLHPCQGLGDIFTIKEQAGDFSKVKVAYVGDGNNVLHSLLYAVAKAGLDISFATPRGYEPDKKILSTAKKIAKDNKGSIKSFFDPKQAVKDADFVYTDVWASMHQENKLKKRKKIFKNYQVNDKLLSLAGKDVKVMHCLPAKRNIEITDKVLDGKNSIVYEQAENRLHVEKAILLLLLKKGKI